MLLEFFRRLRHSCTFKDDSGFTTVELLGNAALAVIAAVFIWGLVKNDLAKPIIDFIKQQLQSS